MSDNDNITRLLGRVESGQPDAENELYELVYGDLNRIAASFMSGQPKGHTLEAGALVNETFLRLTGGAVQWEGRRHFIRVASRAMRSVLTDHARRKAAKKRGPGMHRHPLDGISATMTDDPSETTALAVREGGRTVASGVVASIQE